MIAPPEDYLDLIRWPLTEFLTPDRVGAFLQGYTIPVCRHMRLCDPSISQYYATHVYQLLNRNDASEIHLPILKCQDDSCQVVLRFYVYRKELYQTFRTKEAARIFAGKVQVCDVLIVEVCRTFEDLEFLCHPSQLSCLALPTEKQRQLEHTKKALSHRTGHLLMNMSWYSQAVLDAEYRGLYETVKVLGPHAKEHLEMLQTAPRYDLELSASASSGSEPHRPEANQLRENTGQVDQPPPYQQWG